MSDARFSLAVLSLRHRVISHGVLVRNRRGQATTELLLVSVWFFMVVLLVIQLTVTMAGDEVASYVAYMSVRAETAGASDQVMTQKLKGAIPWAGWVSVAPATDRPVSDGNVRKTVRAPSLFIFEALDDKFSVAADMAATNPFLVEATAEMPSPASRKRFGDNDLF